MNTKSWAKLSLGISVLALVVSIIVLVNRCPTESPTGHVSFDYMGVIVGILALLVTALIGAQVGQYLFVDRKIEKTAGKISRIIARKSANDIARKTAEGTVEAITNDLKHIMDALSPLINARVNTVIGDSARAIGFYLTSLDIYSHIQDSSLRQEYTSSLLEEFQHRVQTWKKNDSLYVLKQYIDSAEVLLDTFDTPLSKEIKEVLRNADERNPDEKMYISSISSL